MLPFQLENRDATYGLAQLIGKPLHEEDAVCIRILKEAGAVPFCRTNVPQTMLTFGGVFLVVRNDRFAEVSERSCIVNVEQTGRKAL